MSNCYFCNKKIETIPYRCKYCGMLFCSEHRIPENHNCPFDLRKSSEFEDSLNRLNLLYQDALDFIDKDLTVAKIYDYFTNKKMNSLEATELLIYLLENSEDTKTRKISILGFKVLELKNQNVFNILENSILSDDNQVIRKTALKVIKELFPQKSKTVLEWSQRTSDDNKSY